MAFWREDLMGLVDGDLDDDDEEDDVIDGRAKSLTQALDNLLQFVVVAAILFSSNAVYLIWTCFYSYESSVKQSGSDSYCCIGTMHITFTFLCSSVYERTILSRISDACLPKLNRKFNISCRVHS